MLSQFTSALLAFTFRYLFNWYPAYRSVGARVKHVSSDFMQAIIELPCNWKTKNHYGITWGGGIYAAIDPVYAVMLYKVFDGQYQVLDKAAEIRFLKPAKSTLVAQFQLTRRRIDFIRHQVESNGSYQCTMRVKLRDENGSTCAICKKVISIKQE